MNWTGKSSLVLLLTVFAVAMTGLLPGVARASDLQGDMPLYYPSFPDAGGPYITAATYHAGDDELRVVFNEPIDPASVAADASDFTTIGFTAAAAAVDAGNRFVVLSNFTGTVEVDVDSLYLADVGVITGADTHVNADIGHVAVSEGPAILYCDVNANWATDDDGDDDAIDVYFDADVALTTADPFAATPELAGAEFTYTVTGNQIRIELDALGVTHFRQVWPGISKVWLEEGGVEWVTGAVANSVAQKRMLENALGGPILIGCYYNAVADNFWMVFSEAVNGASLHGTPNTQYDFSALSQFGGTATQAVAFAGEFTNCVVVNDENPTLVAGATIQVNNGFLIQDFQNESGPQTAMRPITSGFGILRAVYDDGGTETLLDDRLEAWFSEEFANLGNVDSTDFHIDNLTDSVFVYLTIQKLNEGGLGHVIFSGWHVAADSLTALDGRLPVGHRLYVDATSDLQGAQTLSNVDVDARLPILEDYQPDPVLEEVPDWISKIYDVGPPVVDMAYLAWREFGTRESGIPDNSDQFFLFSTWTDPGAFTDGFIEAHAATAIPVGNIGSGLLDDGVCRYALSIEEGVFETSDGRLVVNEDKVYFMLVPATYWGQMSSAADAMIFAKSFVVGPVCPPVDFDVDDDNLIHVAATYSETEGDWIRRVWGDTSPAGGAAPCGDSLYVLDAADPTDPSTNVLGVGPINSNGSFASIYLTVDANVLESLWLSAWGDGAFSVSLEIINDIVSPAVLSVNVDGLIDVDGDGAQDGDMFNPYRIYKADDYINILAKLDDQVGDPLLPTSALSDLLTPTADFTAVDEAATYSGEPVGAIPLVSMGADEIDNDGDWDDTGPAGGNGDMDFPEPYFDENGNGQFDPGETFVDRDGDDHCDCIGGSGTDYDFFLDSADPDEHGWYEIQLDAAAYNDVTKGFQALDPVTDPLGLENFADIKDLPVGMLIIDETYDDSTALADADAPFTCEMDEAEPSVVYVTELYNLADYTTPPVPADNLILPTDPNYGLGRYTSFKVETPSDYDVLFCVAQLDPGTGTFAALTLDPPGVNADTDAPGVAEFDDDRDGVESVTGLGQHNDGIDDDEDGVADNEGEGTDDQDAEVVDASQTEAQDTAAPGGDGIYITTDRRDNDNDAFFTFEPYFDPAGDSYQRVVWYNIDETDEAYAAEADDNEDGIMDGEAMAITADGVRIVVDGVDPADYPVTIWVDAAHVLGAARDGEVDIRGLTEIVTEAYEVLDHNGILIDAFPGLPWGDSTATQAFDWHAIHGAENIDLWHIAELYNLQTDGTDHGYRLWALGYDQAGNVNADYSVPFTFTIDVTPPEVALENCVDGTEDDPSHTGPPDFDDVDTDRGGLQIYNEGMYTLTVEESDETAVEVAFDLRTSEDGGVTWSAWANVDTDPSRPFTAEWDASTIVIDNAPPADSVLVQFRAYGKDEFENWQDADLACVFQITVIDGTPPITWFTLIYDVANGAAYHPPVYWYRDHYGPVQVPVGPAIDIWADFDDDDGSVPPDTTNDVIRVVFEIRQAGEGNEWTAFETITGEVIIDPVTGDTLSVDFTKPVAVTLDTEALAAEYGTGSYDIRVYACDIEGNCNILTADIAMITIVFEGLRAYIQEPHNLAPLDYDLYAINFIHDYDIDFVTFEYFEDLNGNGLDDNDDRAFGSQWYTIDVDNAATNRGDVLLYRGSDNIYDLVSNTTFVALGVLGGEGYIDFDGDGYSDRDPIIRDADGDSEYSAGDVVVLGDPDELTYGTALTDFAADEFHTGTAGAFDTSDWIFKENGMQAAGTLDLWVVNWDATGLEASILVRAVATDEMGAVDDNGGVTIPSAIPTERLILDTVAPVAGITELSMLLDGVFTVIDASTPNIYLPGSVGWFKVLATTLDTDVDNVLFQISDDGGTIWFDLDVNDDDDFYADIDDELGFSDEDEIFLDADGNFVFSGLGLGEDILLSAGDNGVVDTPLGTPLLPLVSEDPAGTGDEDGDEMVDEDDMIAPEDADAPYYVYVYLPPMISDVNVLLQAVAEDQSGNVDLTPVVLQVILGETTAPETDVIEVLTADGDVVDVWPSISDGDGVTQLSGGTVSMHVTAEDASAITYVELMWQFSAECYPELEAWENPWQSMTDDGFSATDDTYPYNFDVDLDAMVAGHGDVVFSFFPKAEDENGNMTPPPVNPYMFRILTNFAGITTDLSDAWVAPGDEFWFEADLDVTPVDPLVDPVVSFYYAERVLLEAIDATRITPDPVDPTYMTLSLLNEMASSPGDHAILTIDDSTCTYYDDLTVLTDATMYDWTYVDDLDPATGHVEFGALPATDAEIIVNYNATEYAQIGDGDSAWPYTVAWDQGDGGVPMPTLGDTDAYDIIAILSYGNTADDQCGLEEGYVSEGLMLNLVNEDAPEVALFALGLHNALPGAFWPGNPSFDSVAGLTEWKMSGVEHEFFVTASDSIDEITDVNLLFTDESGTLTTVAMDLIDENQTNVLMTFTLYESDFPYVPYAFENVTLNLGAFAYALNDDDDDGVWQVTGVPVPASDDTLETTYDFFIDMDGDDYDERVVDPRNWALSVVPVPVAYSSITTPPLPFYYASGTDFGELTAVWRVQAEATDEDGNIGVDGPFTFVYDPVPPTVDELSATSLRFKGGFDVDVYAEVTDPVPADFNVITVESVIFQYCPNYYETDQLGAHVWMDFGTDTDPSDGWIVTGQIPDPENDGFDNNGNGEWDEAEESTSNMAFRAIAVDDGGNFGAPTLLEFVLDDTEPAAVLTNPVEGQVYSYGSVFEVTADITDSEEDIHHVLFQFDAGNGPVDIDITPEDNSDDPWDAEAPYAVSFNTADYLDEEDVYVRFWAVAVDVAENEDGDPEEVLVIINDITGPTAFPMVATTTGGLVPVMLTDPHCAVTGDNVVLEGLAVDPSGWENLATVTVQYWDDVAEDWVDIEITAALVQINDTSVIWAVTWDVEELPEGVYTLRAVATDIDGNYDESPIPVTLAVDHTAPSVFYEPIAGYYDGFAPWAFYDNDGVEGEQGRALTPDPVTGDLDFMVITPDTDASGMVIQYRFLDDPLGEWRVWAFTPDAFDYEPNLDFADGGTDYQVWWLHIDNFADAVGISGVMEVRVLASDYAGNANILHNMEAPEANPWEIWTIDTGDPFYYDFNNDLTADQVESGDPVTFTCVMSDSMTDVVIVRFEYSDGADWIVIDPDPDTEVIEAVALTSDNIDTPYATWTGQITWITPLVYWDTEYPVRAVFYDTPLNEGMSHEQMITVEDNIEPALTKLLAIAPEVHWVDMAEGDGVYMADCENENHDGLFVDLDATADEYDAGTDFAIDYGLAGGVLVPGATATGNLGDPTSAWPRFIDETMIDNDLDLFVSHEVVLVGRSQIHDIGLATVEFWVIPDAGAGEPILVSIDECPPAYGLTYAWHVFWNTLEVDLHGEPIYADGEYQVVVLAEDLEGNREEWVATGKPTVFVDNTAPQATPDADPLTEEVETTITIERNDPFQLFARTGSETDDDIVTFWIKRTRDLNMTESWWMPGEPVDDSDVNPDPTRPYVYDWDLNQLDPPLPVGEQFDMSTGCADILGNAEGVLDAFDDGRFITMTIVDTQAPMPTITEIARITGDVTPIVLPHLMDGVHARDFDYLQATLLNAENDCERVEFMFMPEGGTEPTLIDADIEWDAANPYIWTITDWDLAALAPGTYLVWARGTDDVGNAIDGPTFTLVVDYTGPVYAVVTPTDGMMECPTVTIDGETTTLTYDLLFTSVDVDIWDDSIAWEWKKAEDADDDANWNGIETDILFDADSGAWAGLWDVTLLADGLYDVRLTVFDVSGNETKEIVATNVVWDATDPEINVTRVQVEGEDVYPTLPVDITIGDVITMWITAQDDEVALPDAYETGLTQILFEARRLPSGDWFDLGLWQPPDETIYTEVEESIDWNTSGLLEGEYEVRAWAIDALCNETPSGAITVVVSDLQPPRARIAGFDPWQFPHGDDRTNYCDIYAIAYCDTHIDEVQFQYTTDEGTSWIPIGIPEDIEDDGGVDEEICDLWYTTIALDSLGVGAEFTLRAIARDDAGNQDSVDAPTLDVTIIQHSDGTLDLIAAEDLGVVAEVRMEALSADETCDMLVTVTMLDETQYPHVMWVHTLPVGDGGDPECIEMTRMIDNALMWRGTFPMPENDCGKYTVFASGLINGEIDLHRADAWTYEVTDELGTNGVASVPGYLAEADSSFYLYATCVIPPGNNMSDECLLLAPAWAPQLNQDEAHYLRTMERTSYHIGLACDYDYQEVGFWGTCTIEYDEAALLAACGGDSEEVELKEAFITVRRHDAYYNEAWSGEYIQQISVDTENNVVSFICTDFDYDEAIFALFVPKWNGPVVVRTFTPDSPYDGRWNYTDRDPVIVIDLNGYGNADEYVDEGSIQLWIDGNLVATEDWVQGDGDGGNFDIEPKNADSTLYQLIYTHSTARMWWLDDGWHTLNVRYKLYDDYDFGWIELPPGAPGARFFVDATAPTMEFWSGWVDNPTLHNSGAYDIAGYLNPDNEHEMLTVAVYDAGLGALVCPTVVGPDGEDEGLFGMKYDLWLVHYEDDQREIDEIEERILLHAGTCDELYLSPPLLADSGAYVPDDTLMVALPIIAGGHNITDGDILEVVLYSEKHMEDWDELGGCHAEVVLIGDDSVWVYVDCWFDYDLRVHVYDQGWMDWAGNVGSEYLEQRFVVDMTPPEVTLITPAGGVTTPSGEFCFEAKLSDSGAGVGSASAVLIDSHGEEIELASEPVVTDGKITGCVEGGLDMGTYTLLVTATDTAGNSATLELLITVQSATLALSNAHIAPNPFNPSDIAGTIHFNLSRQADITIKAYDFAGEYVGTVVYGKTGVIGANQFPWEGRAPDGTALANGAYLIRVEAYDGSARKAATIKAVIWRE